jgi:hypothetical protein
MMFFSSSARIEILIEDTRRTLKNIDFDYTIEIEKLERSGAEKTLKAGIAQKLRERHQERREPYVKLIRELTIRLLAPSATMLEPIG